MGHEHFTVLPFLLAMLIAVAAMPTDVVQVCYGEMGHEHTQPWRSKALTWCASRVRTWLSSLRAFLRHPLAVPAACAVLFLLIALFAPVPVSGATLVCVFVTGSYSHRPLLL